ncbi:MAG: hypothetical protein ACFFF9_10345 [Candidatus Thorarchaeota archaeon]
MHKDYKRIINTRYLNAKESTRFAMSSFISRLPDNPEPVDPLYPDEEQKRLKQIGGILLVLLDQYYGTWNLGVFLIIVGVIVYLLVEREIKI